MSFNSFLQKKKNYRRKMGMKQNITPKNKSKKYRIDKLYSMKHNVFFSCFISNSLCIVRESKPAYTILPQIRANFLYNELNIVVWYSILIYLFKIQNDVRDWKQYKSKNSNFLIYRYMYFYQYLFVYQNIIVNYFKISNSFILKKFAAIVP